MNSGTRGDEDGLVGESILRGDLVDRWVGGGNAERNEIDLKVVTSAWGRWCWRKHGFIFCLGFTHIITWKSLPCYLCNPDSNFDLCITGSSARVDITCVM